MRKLPQQERSRQMVATLIEATAQCIAERGLDNTSTPMIAERAGVSVGSLYQYFSSKEALIEAMVSALADDIGKGLSRLPIPPEAGLRDLVSIAIRFGFATLHSQDGLYLELVRNWHRLPTQKVADVLQQHFLELARLYFLKHYREYPIEDLQVRLFIITNSTLFTMVRQVSQQSAWITEDAVAEGLIDMITGYLQVASNSLSR